MENTVQEELVFDPKFLEIGEEQSTTELTDKPPKMAEEPITELNLFKDNVLEHTDAESKKTKESEDVGILDNNSLPPDNIKDKKDSSLFSVVLGQDLMGEGVLSTFDEEEIIKISKEQGEAAAISHMIQRQIQESDAQLKESYDKEYQDYLSLVQGGVPKQEAAGILGVENFVNSVKQIDLKDESDGSVQARKDLLTLNYRLTTKWSDDKIQKYVDKAYDEGSDLEEVDEALTNVEQYVANEKSAQIESAKANDARIKAEQAKQLSDLKTYIDKSEEFFKGDKITKLVKDKMVKAITTPIKLQNGVVTSELWAKREENPISFDSKIAYLNAIGFFDEKPLDKFMKNAETKAVSGLQQFLQDNGGRSYKGSAERSFSSREGSKDPLDSILNI